MSWQNQNVHTLIRYWIIDSFNNDYFKGVKSDKIGII